MPQDTKTAEALERKKNLWHSLSQFWNYIHWSTGILGVLMSTLAAAGEVAGESAPIYSVIAAICFGIIGFANPQKQSARYEDGYLILEEALLKYNALPPLLTINELFDAYNRAEGVVHGVGTVTEPPHITQPPVTHPVV